MSHFGDPGFVYHRTMAQVLALMTAKLADEPVISFSASDYATALRKYLDQVASKLEKAESGVVPDPSSLSDDEKVELRARHRSEQQRQAQRHGDHGSSAKFKLGLDHLYEAVGDFKKKADDLDQEAAELRTKIQEHIPWWRWPARIKLGLAIRKTNSRYKQLERNFLYAEGLDGRDWFKHVVFAPGLWTGYAGAVFPGLGESIDDQDWENALRWVDIIQDCIVKAGKSI